MSQDEPFFIPSTLKKIYVSRKSDIKAVIISSSDGSNIIDKIDKQIKFMGLKVFIIYTLDYIYKKISDFINIGKPEKLHNPKLYFRKNGVPFLEEEDVNNDSFIEKISLFHPDLIISISSPKIFRDKLLNLPKKGCINLHGSYLPDYRGLMPAFWQLYNNEKYAGITVHKMASRIDNGPIVKQKKFRISDSETHYSLVKKSKAMGALLILQVIDEFEKGLINLKNNDVQKGQYFTYPSIHEISRFRKNGNKLR